MGQTASAEPPAVSEENPSPLARSGARREGTPEESPPAGRVTEKTDYFRVGRPRGQNLSDSPLISNLVSCCDGLVLVARPSALLAPHVERLWYCDGHRVVNGTQRVLLPDGRFQLAISLAEGPISALTDPMGDGAEIAPSLLIGIRSRFNIIDTAKLRSAMGVVFRPGGVHAFLGTLTDAFHNKNVSLDLIWGSMVRSLRDRLRTGNDPAEKFRVLEVALLARLNERLQLSTAVRYALQEFARRPEIPRVRELAHEAGLSRRRFSQLFREQIGLTPKRYCRLQRFQNTLKLIASGASVDWAQLALAAGYCDQAHLAHEFHDFSGLSPSAYLASPSPSGSFFHRLS
jgi:AraC-like DNA-binding protein